MRGLMMETPLLVSSLIRHAALNHGDTEIVSRDAAGAIHRYTYADAYARACQLANALTSVGIGEGDTVATMAWNDHRHFEAYYGISGIGAVCHTINPRLFHEQIRYIINHAADSYVLFDPAFIKMIELHAGDCKMVKGWIALSDRRAMPESSLENLICYEDFIGGQPTTYEWPTLDENSASGLCYTSGTTGEPKGVLYSNRSTVLHAMACALPDALGLSERETIMPVASMFHVMAWGLPYSAALVGAKLVLPGPKLDPESILRLIEEEGVTMSAAVPTIWLALAQYLKQTGKNVGTLKEIIVGGAACPKSLIATFEGDFGVNVLHAWGMTETSPLGTVGRLKALHDGASADGKLDLKSKQGHGFYGIEMKIVDGEGRELPRDGQAFGDLLVRGPWVSRAYHKLEDRQSLIDGWFHTGDVATIDAEGYMQITDRSKDVIKSGGEWISSIALENLAVSHPAVREAAVIGIPHAKWTERPLLIVVVNPEPTVTREELLDYFDDKVAKWWKPDDVVFVDELPHTATGKLLKTKLREEYQHHLA